MAGGGADRWGVERAIKQSALPAPSRLILHTLLTHVTNGTLVVPPEFAPSLTILVRETGLGRGTVADHLNRLEAEGWVTRQRPTTAEALAKRARTGYRLTVPVRESDGSGSRTSPRAGRVEEDALFSTRPGAGPVREPDGTRPRAGHNPMSSPTSPSPSEKERGVGGGGSRRRKPETSAPEIFPVTGEMRAWASTHKRTITVNLDDQTERFLNHARQADRRCRDWIAAWRNWILKAQDFADRDQSRAATGTDGIRGHGPRARVNDVDWSQGGPRV